MFEDILFPDMESLKSYAEVLNVLRYNVVSFCLPNST
jgi:hypothetical protein